jgi:DNA-directed RNA polymerase subunit H
LVKKEKEVVINVFQHELVPRHVILDRKEAEDVLKKYHVKPYQFPYIKVSDPACQMIGAKPGDLVRITRRSSTAGEAPAYRYVIED